MPVVGMAVELVVAPVRPDPVLRAQSAVTGRDLVLLGWLYEHGVLTTPQIATALFPSLDFTQKRLAKLLALGVVERFRPQRPDGGSFPYHWVLSQLGLDVIAPHLPDQDAVPTRAKATARRRRLTSRANLPHLLGINGFFTDLAGYARTHPRASLDRWWSTSRCASPGGYATSHDEFRRFYAIKVRPDGHGIWAERDNDGDDERDDAGRAWRVAFWLEYDTGSQPLTTLIAKVAAYGTTMTDPQVRCGDWPLLFSLPNRQRQTNFHDRLATERPRIPVATMARDYATSTGKTPADDVWRLHGHTDPGTPFLHLADLAELEELVDDGVG